MSYIVEGTSILNIKNWHEMLANLTKTAWRSHGTCYFPYIPLINPDFWLDNVKPQWLSGQVYPWVMINDGRIVAHSALVKKSGNKFELGRWNAYKNSPRGAVSQLAKAALKFATENGWQVCVECTQAHTTSQFICEERLGLRFAGVGILDSQVDTGITWDIIYYDNLKIEPFMPTEGILGNPWGQALHCESRHRERLEEISKILSTERGGKLPPDYFHILPSRLKTIEKIICQNL